MERRHGDIKLSFVEELAVNLCALGDSLDALGIRSLYCKCPSAFQTYYQRDNAKRPWQKMISIWNGKIDKTKKLVYHLQKNEGKIGEKMKSSAYHKTICGRISLLVAQNHYQISNNSYH